MSVLVLRADARDLPLPDACTDLIVTSPPYFGLRSYTDGGEHYAGQVGSEATPAAYVDALVACTREWVRVLKPSGSLFINLGDKYSSGNGGDSHLTELGARLGTGGGQKSDVSKRRQPPVKGVPPKSLLGLPWRYALAVCDQLGLILRAEIVWAKPNGQPESVTDRVRRAHEQVFHFVLRPRYYSAVDEIREPHIRPLTAEGMRSNAQSAKNGMRHGGAVGVMRGGEMPRDGGEFTASNPLGKLPVSVWSIPSQPLTVPPALGVDHFAAFPMELPRRLILGWSPRAICGNCGFLLGSSYDQGMLGVQRTHNGRARKGPIRPRTSASQESVLLQDVLDPPHGTKPSVNHLPPPDDARLRGGLETRASDGAEERLSDGAPTGDGRASGPDAGQAGGRPSSEQHQDGQPDREPGTARQGRARPVAEATARAVRMPALRRAHPHRRDPEHACPHCGSDQLRPSVIVDGFGGTGTTALLAHVNGRHGITIDRSADYCRIAAWRTSDRREIAAAMQVPRPEPVSDLQEALWPA